MRKVLCISLLLLFVIAWSACGDSTRPTVPTFTSQLVFIRAATGGGTSASLRHSIESSGLRASVRKPMHGPGLKPYLIANGTDSIVLMKNDGTGQTVVTDQGGIFWSVQLSMNGKKGVGTAEDENGYSQVFVADMSNLQNNQPLQLTNDNENHYVPQISPDNKTVIFVKYDSASGTYQAFTVPASGGSEKLIPTPTVEINFPSYTPDGKKIVFEEEIHDTINIMNLDGTGMKTLTNVGGTDYFDEFPSVSPDGKLLVFSRYGKGMQTAGEDIYTANMDGTNVKQLTNNGGTGDSWDPFFVNNKIVFVYFSPDTHSNDIYSMNVDGTGAKNLSSNVADEYFVY